MRGPERRRDNSQVRIRGDYALDHPAVACRVESRQRLADALDLEAERGGEVLFVAQQDVDLRDQLTVDFLRSSLPADRLPQGGSVVEVIGDDGAVAPGRLHRSEEH